jgi:hypothetical protein
LTAHGTDPANVDEETFSDIAVMFHAGLIGNLGILEVLGTLTAGQFNKVLPKGKAGFTLKDIIPHAYDYLYPPQTEQEKKDQASQNLLAFAMMSPSAPEILFKGN